MLGKVYNKVKIQGENFIPLQPKNIRRDLNDAKKVIIKFHVPVPPLVIDTKTMPQIVDNGFLIYHKRATQTITGIQLISDDEVEITCAADLTEDIDITYAGQNANGQGNLRDSDPYQAVFTYVDIDKKDRNGNYIYPRSNNRTLRPAYEPRNAQGEIIYNQPYPLYNFSVGFYYRLPKGQNELQIISGVNDVSVKKNELEIVQTGNMVKIVMPAPEAVTLKIFDLTGKLIKDFGHQLQYTFSLEFLNKGVYLAQANTGYGTVSSKISL
jgi:hypothetical protein